MGDTFNAFVKFISDDPIMLGLCIAIVVLVILFIIVLLIGNKKEEVIEDSNKIKEEKAELLKTEVNLEALKSTQEYKLDEINEVKDNSSINEPVSVIQDFNPSSISSEAVDVQSEVSVPKIEENVLEPVKEPVVPTFDSLKIKTDDSNKMATNFQSENIQPKIEMEENIFNEDFSKVEMPVLNNNHKVTTNDEPVMPSIIESTVNPVEPVMENINNKVDTEQLLDTFLTKKSTFVNAINNEAPKMEVPSFDFNDSFEEMNSDNFSKTDIIKHVPKMETNIFDNSTPVKEETSFDEEDIVLPKLKTNVDNTRLNSLSGETFNIK